MGELDNLRAEKVVKAFNKAGWTIEGQKGSHIKLTKAGNPNILSIPVHKGKAIKKGLLSSQIKKAGLSLEDFLRFYK